MCKDYTVILNKVYQKMIQLTDGEEDEEIKQYNEYLLDGLQETIQHIRNLQKTKGVE